MRKQIESREYTNRCGRYLADLFLEAGDPAPTYVLELTDPNGVLVQRTSLSTLLTYNLKRQHGLEASAALFSGAEAYVQELQNEAAFKDYLKALGLDPKAD